ncbi:MAG: ABC transporter ATP-binding protein [Eubacterium sp.]|nr:ABC transporter ATP-binding protein [Eubacterium sp.]
MVEVHNLTKTYGTVQALRGVDFTLEPGKVYGLLGVNGAGKTTTLQLLAGYITPTAGEVLVDGISMEKSPVETKQKIGYLPEQPPLYPELTVEEFLTFQAELRRIPKKQREEAVEQAVGVGNLSSVRNRLIGQLSKGFRQRVGLSATLMGDPEILLLDEPTNGLDPVQMVEMRKMIRSLGKDRIVVVSSHVLSEITREADEVLIIAAGQLVLSGKMDQLTGETRVLEVEIKGSRAELRPLMDGCLAGRKVTVTATGEGMRLLVREKAGEDLREAFFHAAAEAGLPILFMQHRTEDIEDVFLHVTEEAYLAENGPEEEDEEND